MLEKFIYRGLGTPSSHQMALPGTASIKALGSVEDRTNLERWIRAANGLWWLNLHPPLV